MSEALTDRVEFDFIRYANCWEDADILLEALQPGEGDKVLSVASAGDNSFAMLSRSPQLVVGIDVNPVQIYLCELKKAAFQLSSHDDFIHFLGFKRDTPENRKKLYTVIRPFMPENAAKYWDRNFAQIESGILYEGKIEKYFGTFRKFILPLIHSKKNIRELFAEKDNSMQEKFYFEKWNTFRWRLFFKIFFSRFVMGRFGRDPEFMNEVKVSVSKYIFGRAEAHLKRSAAQGNYLLHYILTGNFGNMLPFYARKENFDIIKKNISRIVFETGYAQDAISKHGKFNVFNLSNIFEYMDVSTARSVAGALIAGAEKGARLAYWNLMVPRKLSSYFNSELTYSKELSEELTERDKGFFYLHFHHDIKK